MVGSRHAAVVATLVCFGLWTASEHAYACSPVANMTLEVGDGDTGEAPSGIGDPSATMKRGKGATGGCAQQSTSCDDMGSFAVHFTAAKDPDSSPKSVGYRVDVIAGTAPLYSLDEYADKVLLPLFDADDGDAATLYFHWLDGDTDDQESIDFTITLTPVDANGNEGPTSEPIRIRDDGGSGCAIGERRFEPSWNSAATALLVAATAFARRRSRRSRLRGCSATSRIS